MGVTSADALAAKKSGGRGSGSIAFSGLRSVFHFLKSGNATLTNWEATASGDTFADDQGGHCRLIERRRIADGETLDTDGTTARKSVAYGTRVSVSVATGCYPLSNKEKTIKISYI